MKKSKIFLSILSLCFSLAVLTFGVFAANQVNYTISGNISYTVSDVFVEVKSGVYYTTSQTITSECNSKYIADRIVFDTEVETGTFYYYPDDAWYKVADDEIEEMENGEIWGCPVTTVVMQQLQEPTTMIKTYDASSGTLLNPPSPNTTTTSRNLTFGTGANQGYSYFITFEILNYGREPVNVTVTPTLTGSNVYSGLSCPTSFTVGTNGGGNSYFSKKICYGLCLEDLTSNSNATYQVSINITRPSTITTNSGYTLYKFADGYYKMKMGNYQGQDIYWRMLRNNSSNVTTDVCDGLEDGVSGNAIFIQDTYAMEKKFLDESKITNGYINAGTYNGITVGNEEKYANDYSVSDIRGYLISTTSGGFASDLGLTSAQVSAITAVTVEGCTDKFWLLSKGEACGDSSESGTTWNSSNAWFNEIEDEENPGWLDRIMLDKMGRDYVDNFYEGGSYYWLRSPYADISNLAYYVHNDGDIYYDVVYRTRAVRAAFQLAL